MDLFFGVRLCIKVVVTFSMRLLQGEKIAVALQQLKLALPSVDQQIAVGRLAVQLAAPLPKISALGLVNVGRKLHPKVSLPYLVNTRVCFRKYLLAVRLRETGYRRLKTTFYL